MQLHFDSMPAPVREAIFLRLRPSDLESCLHVCSSWKEFVAGEILTSERNKTKRAVATHRRAFAKVVCDEANNVEVESMWMLAACDVTERTVYMLAKPATGNDWPLKRYSLAEGKFQETDTVTLLTSHFIMSMEVLGGHLVLFKQPREQGDNGPAVHSLTSVPWGGRMPIENGMPMPNDAFHFSRLLLGNECLYVVSKNAHITWTKNQGGAFTEETHETFADVFERPIVVHRLSKQSGSWTDVARLQPEHAFAVMEKYTTIPNKEVNPKYKDDTCLLHLSNDVITERYMLVSCALHGHYQMFDYVHDFSMWAMNTTVLPFENVRGILRDSKNDSSHVMAAIREGYVLVYAEPGKASLYSVEGGEPMGQVEGRRFLLSDRYVISVETGGNKKNFDVTVVDSVTGKASAMFTYQRLPLAYDVNGDRPWQHDDEALADFAGISKQRLPEGPTWPIFERKAMSYWGFGHALLDSNKMIFWKRDSANKFILKTGELKLAFETEAEAAEAKK